MPKTQNADLLRRFSMLQDIPSDEWDDMFPKQHSLWTTLDEAYLRNWYSVIPLIEMSYALDRPPWSVMEKAKSLGLRCKREESSQC